MKGASDLAMPATYASEAYQNAIKAADAYNIGTRPKTLHHFQHFSLTLGKSLNNSRFQFHKVFFPPL